MKRISKVLVLMSVMFTMIFTLISCRQKLDDTPLENMVTVADFTKGENESFFASNGWCNGNPFNVTWSKKNVKYEDGVAKLFISENEGAEVPYYGGEIRSKNHYHYGDYEITMKVDPTKGTCTSFFVYTGPSEFDENGNPNPHDEVDIEFLGKEITHVQFNFFVNGKGGNEYMYDLGFDASEEFHRYGFRWTESYITWYVDGVPVYRVDEKPNKPLPKTPGRMMTNYWCGTKEAELWMSKYSYKSFEDGAYSSYQNISTSATPIVDPNTSIDPTEGVDWSKIEPLTGLTAESSDNKHTIESNGKDYKVTYTDVKGGTYNNVKFTLGNKASGMNYLYLTLTNNTKDKYSNVRIDVFGDATRKTANNTSVCNVSASMDGEEVVTDLNWGGSTFSELEPGKTVEIIIYFEGIATDIQIMFDSSTYEDTKVYAGDITVSNIKFGVYGELKLPEGAIIPPTEEELNWSNVDSLSGLTAESSDGKHTITANGTSYKVVYANVNGGTYNNVRFDLADYAKDTNYVYLKATNNGTAPASIRIDVFGDATRKTTNNQTVCNISATMDGNAVSTDLDWGGSLFGNIQAGATVEIIIYFEGVAESLQIMFDSYKYQDTNVYSGDVTISEIKFAKDGDSKLPETNEPTNEPTVEPTEPSVSTGTDILINDVSKKFEGNLDAYQLAYNENTLNVKYSNVKGDSYMNINTQVTDIAGTNNVVTIKITNNGSSAVKVRVDINSLTKVNATYASNVSATQDGNGVYTDTTWGGSMFTIAANSTSVCVITFDATRNTKELMLYFDSATYGDSNLFSGNVTISEIEFKTAE